MAKGQQITQSSSTPLEDFDRMSGPLLSFQAHTTPGKLRENVIPLVETIAAIRDLLAKVGIDELKDIANHEHASTISHQAGEIINKAEISNEVKEMLRQLITAFFIRITAVLSAPRRGRPPGSKTTRTPAPRRVDKSPAKPEIPEETIEQYRTALELTLENYNSSKENLDKLDPTIITSAKQIPAELKTMLTYIPFMIIAKTGDSISVAAVKKLMDSEDGRKAAAKAITRIFTRLNAGAASSMFAWVAPKFREKTESTKAASGQTRWESAVDQIKNIQLQDHPDGKTIGELLDYSK